MPNFVSFPANFPVFSVTMMSVCSPSPCRNTVSLIHSLSNISCPYVLFWNVFVFVVRLLCPLFDAVFLFWGDFAHVLVLRQGLWSDGCPGREVFDGVRSVL